MFSYGNSVDDGERAEGKAKQSSKQSAVFATCEGDSGDSLVSPMKGSLIVLTNNGERLNYLIINHPASPADLYDMP
ncbi:Uncharacterized protein HZ326_1889 [Fusarium oxysporum f. sp. albedinis]|jgi:hypothetical protein|nr:Uncharacterized protein HZ326_1889 [Fusarium oxysporum f. sp. albedinis]